MTHPDPKADDLARARAVCPRRDRHTNEYTAYPCCRAIAREIVSAVSDARAALLSDAAVEAAGDGITELIGSPNIEWTNHGIARAALEAALRATERKP